MRLMWKWRLKAIVIFVLVAFLSDDVTGDAIQRTYERKAYDILLNAYMRSGSTFTGRLLSFFADGFYWYEPLWNYNSGVFYWGSDKICHDTGCSQLQPWSPTVKLHPKTMQNVLTRIYRCDFNTLVPAVAETMTDIRSGESWTEYRKCRKDERPMNSCLKDLQQLCRRAKHKITKVVRLTLDNLEYVLDANPRVKVIHLFRDPRAIINSRLKTDWYNLLESPNTNHTQIKLNAKYLCDRMHFDFRAGLNLKRKYPDRFAFVFYEDLLEDIIPRAKHLVAYFGIDPASLDTTPLENISIPLEGVSLLTKQSKREYSSWWRSNMKYDVVKIVDSVCSVVYKALGYNMLTNTGALQNSSILSYELREEFRVENIHRNLPYKNPDPYETPN